MKKGVGIAIISAWLLSLTAAVMAAGPATESSSIVGDSAAGRQKSVTCQACHNVDGNSTNPEWPNLAGQHAKYLVKQLREFKAGNDPQAKQKRINSIMNGMAAALTEQDMADLAAYYENQTGRSGEADPALVQLGKEIYLGGSLVKGIPACMACHGASGRGNPAAGFPSLAGQHAQYTETQLKAFRSMQRANDPGQMMRVIAAKLSDAEIQAVASYIQGLQQ